jgi:3-phosphoshikimate 1-carboxyvinyltransferase
MTISMLRDSGIGVTVNQNVIEIPKQNFTSGKLMVENDWSSASFWYEIAALSDNAEILLRGLKKDSIRETQLLMILEIRLE